jgi:hypothetical protein
MSVRFRRAAVNTAALLAAAGAWAQAPARPAAPPAPAPVTQVVFVITMENEDGSSVYGNTTDAPYINNVLLKNYAYSTDFFDELPGAPPSEPHYVWMEAGTNKFKDHTFQTDGDATASNSTSGKKHLVTEIKKAHNGTTWMSYQEGIDATSGACPISSSGATHYAAKHDPFVFFQDVSGSPPSKTNAYCASHHEDLSLLAGDLQDDAVATYNFITPNLCHDMHGDSGCSNGNDINAGDQWLQANLPALITYADAHEGVIFITWDESEDTRTMPFIAVGPHVKAGYAGGVAYDHSSLLKSIEEIVQVPVLKTVSKAKAKDLADLFVSGFFP